MMVAVALVALGLVTTHLLGRLSARGPSAVVVAAHLAALLLVWTGVVDLFVGAAGLAHGLVEVCQLALTDRPGAANSRVAITTGAVLALMALRAGLLADGRGGATGPSAARARRRARRRGELRRGGLCRLHRRECSPIARSGSTWKRSPTTVP